MFVAKYCQNIEEFPKLVLFFGVTIPLPFCLDQSLGARPQLVQNWTEQDLLPSGSPGTPGRRAGPEDHRHHHLLPGCVQGVPGQEVSVLLALGLPLALSSLSDRELCIETSISGQIF